MLNAERHSLIRFLALYGISTTLFLIVISSIYYDYQKQTLLSDKLQSMQVYADKVENSLRNVKKLAEIDEYYAEDPRYEITIYDEKFRPLFGSFSNEKIDWSINFYTKGEHIYFIDRLDLHYLKARYIVIRGYNLEETLLDVREQLYLTIGVAFAFILIMSYFLAKAFLKPLREAIAKMDDFIKDTTHELNTPLSAILMSIETINKDQLDELTRKKIKRIEAASRTISALYQGLSFSALYGKTHEKLEEFDLQDLLLERIEYFEPLAESKQVHFEYQLSPLFLKMDRLKMQIVIDNLFSNAVKYNKKGGNIVVITENRTLSVKDNGIGVGTAKLEDIFARYARFDSATGGFGLGLAIVKAICDEYDIKIEISSAQDKGTEFRLAFGGKF